MSAIFTNRRAKAQPGIRPSPRGLRNTMFIIAFIEAGTALALFDLSFMA
jgi:hypothetical protein